MEEHYLCDVSSCVNKMSNIAERRTAPQGLDHSGGGDGASRGGGDALGQWIQIFPETTRQEPRACVRLCHVIFKTQHSSGSSKVRIMQEWLYSRMSFQPVFHLATINLKYFESVFSERKIFIIKWTNHVSHFDIVNILTTHHSILLGKLRCF